MAVFSHAFFDQCKEERFPLAPLLRKHIAQGQVTGEVYNGLWFDIGTRERLDELNSLLVSN
jgi:MurNAc alpha-1-phosphate uridylyltransferase